MRLEDNGPGRRRVHRRPGQDPHRQQHGGQQSRDLAQTAQRALKIRLPEIDDHIQNWFDCIKSREKPIADVEIGHRSAILCHLGNIARWVGRPLRWDPEREIFPGDDEANATWTGPAASRTSCPSRCSPRRPLEAFSIGTASIHHASKCASLRSRALAAAPPLLPSVQRRRGIRVEPP